jgi:hypothetical protein
LENRNLKMILGCRNFQEDLRGLYKLPHNSAPAVASLGVEASLVDAL